MATVDMACVVPGCDMGNGAPYKTEMVEAGIAWNMLQLHINHAHTAVEQADPAAREARPQAERVKRPILTLSSQSINQEDYNHFKYLYSQYKTRLGDTTEIPAVSASAWLTTCPRCSSVVWGLR